MSQNCILLLSFILGEAREVSLDEWKATRRKVLGIIWCTQNPRVTYSNVFILSSQVSTSLKIDATATSKKKISLHVTPVWYFGRWCVSLQGVPLGIAQTKPLRAKVCCLTVLEARSTISRYESSQTPLKDARDGLWQPLYCFSSLACDATPSLDSVFVYLFIQIFPFKKDTVSKRPPLKSQLCHLQRHTHNGWSEGDVHKSM